MRRPADGVPPTGERCIRTGKRTTVITRKRAILAATVTFGFVAIAAATIAFRNLGSWLVVSDPLPPSLDIIFTFGGDPERYEHSKELARRYTRAFWIISTGKIPVFDTLTMGEIVRRSVAYEGFDTLRVLVDDTCSSTGAELNLLASLLSPVLESAENSNAPHPDLSDTTAASAYDRFGLWLSRTNRDTLHVGLVSAHYHTRRIKMLANRWLKNDRIVFHILPVPYGEDTNRSYCQRHWWRYDTDASFVFSEIIKLAYYFTVRDRMHAGRQ